ncbi:MAG TPA: 4'-phosphopantetheinyl transferase superfamily protein [Kribbellaceae bacterium]|nr:4'-phosphopantetheinyl transferase superfamily protein [Kribbellaceae bacterium]
MTGSPRSGAVLVDDTVHVAATTIDAVSEGDCLPADRRAAGRLPAWRAREHLAARALLRRLLSDVVGPDAAAEPLAVRDTGQPYLPRRPDLAVSLSHTDGWVAAAAGVGVDVGVGVDAQMPFPVSDGIVRRCCTASARAMFATLAPLDRALELAWIWSVQEACVKATGEGLAGRPWRIPVEVGQRTGRWQRVRWVALRDRFELPVSCAYGTAVPP